MKAIYLSIAILTFLAVFAFIPVIEQIDNRYIGFIYDSNDPYMWLYAQRHPEMMSVDKDGNQLIWMYSPEWYDALKAVEAAKAP